jgi:5-methylcytosine-specific restriction endonuclease McrA
MHHMDEGSPSASGRPFDKCKPSPKAIRRHVEKLRGVIKNHKASRQEHLIYALNRVIRGWTNYYSTVVSKQTFAQVNFTLTQMLRAWAKRRHPNTGTWGAFRRYCRKNGAESRKFQPPSGHPQLHQHVSTPIRRHVKVQAKRSPYDGDWIYWGTRRGRSPDVSTKVARLLRKQRGRCIECGLYFRDGESMEVERINPKASRRDAHYNLMLLHRYCQKERNDELRRLAGTYDKRHGMIRRPTPRFWSSERRGASSDSTPSPIAPCIQRFGPAPCAKTQCSVRRSAVLSAARAPSSTSMRSRSIHPTCRS